MAGTTGVDYERIGAESKGYTPAEIADRVLGSDLQRELVESVHLPDREPIEPDTDYFLERLEATEPKTIRQYVASVRTQIDDLEGYPELKRYVEEQADRLGMGLGSEPSSLGQLLGGSDPTPTDGAATPAEGAPTDGAATPSDEPSSEPAATDDSGSDMAEIDISEPDEADGDAGSSGGEDDE